MSELHSNTRKRAHRFARSQAVVIPALSCVVVLIAARTLWSQRAHATSAPLRMLNHDTHASHADPDLLTHEPPASSRTQAVLASSGEHERRIDLGRQIFFDETLSEPRGTSCASCHDPKHAYSGNHGSRIGTALGSRPKHFARRNTPSLLYLKFVRPFHFHWEEDAPLPDAVGGFFWDGRADSIAELVRQPLLNPDEMGNRSARNIAVKLQRAEYAANFAETFGLAANDWGGDEVVLGALGRALEAFLTSDAMTPFSSKYDAYVRGRAELSPLEKRGLTLFRDATKGGCDVCHKLNDASPNPERSLFTDYGFEALAVPRNRKLPANKAATHFDLGLCEPDQRHFPVERELWCGSFRTPSLRNVAVRTSYMHNGAFSDLRDVVKFYATRDVTPRRWYKSAAAFDDVPAKYRAQVGVERVPYDRHEGQVPRLNDSEIDAVVAFLQTLTDAAYVADPTHD
jgi:cytochrome c peroxidase